MNRIAKIAALFVVLTAVFSFGQDSLTVALLKESHSFYSTSFNTLVGVIAVLIALAIVILGYFNSRKVEEIKNELEKTKSSIKNELETFKNKLENELKNKFEDDIEKKLYGEIEYTYFSLAISSFKENGDNIEHFRRLAEHFFILTKHKSILENIDLKRLGYFDDWIEKYNDIEVARIFLFELNKFIEYGEETYPRGTNSEALKYLRKSKEIWKKLCEQFGSQDIILGAIKNFDYYDYNYSIRKSK